MDINSFQMKRVNPFQGLVVDADTWKDAHNYHRQNMKLHIFAFHKTGIVSGFEVTASSPADASVNIGPGIAIDPEGNAIIMPQRQRYHLQTHEKGRIYLVIQFREIPGEPFQPPEGGQPTRILEAYRLQERDALPSEAYVELARLDFDPAMEGIKNAKNPGQPAVNEINLNFREEAIKAAPERIPAVIRETPPVITRETSAAAETALIGYFPLGGANKDLHRRGLHNLVKELNRYGHLPVAIEDEINLKKPLGRFSLIYITSNGRFEVTPEQQSALNSYLQSGGIIFGDGCSLTTGGVDSKGAKEFGLAFNRLAVQFNSKLGIVQRGHQLLSSEHIFSEVPAGCEPPMLLEGGNMICSSSDYGCAWDGGHGDQPLPRDAIRSALEIGANILAYALRTKGMKK
jgi:hypothetical protein